MILFPELHRAIAAALSETTPAIVERDEFSDMVSLTYNTIEPIVETLLAETIAKTISLGPTDDHGLPSS